MNLPPPCKILLIQSAYPGDVVLSLAAAETLHTAFPSATMDYLVREGCEGLFERHPFVRRVWTWNKSSRLGFLKTLAKPLRSEHYDAVIVFQRHLRSGILALACRAPVVAGYSENPVARFFTHRLPYFDPVTHRPSGSHESHRCNLLATLPWQVPETQFRKPALYTAAPDLNGLGLEARAYVVCAPGSLWFTKRLPEKRWAELCNRIPEKWPLVFLGSTEERSLCDRIIHAVTGHRCLNLAGETGFLESAALMQHALLSIVQDSAPLHLASAVNAPVCVLYGSTRPAFGFGPLSSVQCIVETTEPLACRPCGLHGHQHCPLGHFKCMETLPVEKAIDFLNTLC